MTTKHDGTLVLLIVLAASKFVALSVFRKRELCVSVREDRFTLGLGLEHPRGLSSDGSKKLHKVVLKENWGLDTEIFNKTGFVGSFTGAIIRRGDEYEKVLALFNLWFIAEKLMSSPILR